ncbi:DUF6039 family protein [Streptomyces sp. NPDC002506]|uniref:DUF6039 family protein n=1 Tax=Streptomyces sp. NPDC002506 TaxID=3154536 RepID=UPI00332F7D9B
MTEDSNRPVVPPALHQTSQPPEKVLHSGNAGVVVERVAQIAAGQSGTARALAREAAEFANDKHAGLVTVFVYDETFGVKDRIHWLIHFNSLEDYERLLHMGGAQDFRDGVLGGFVAQRSAREWEAAFVPGSVQETMMFPHRWGMFGTATQKMAQDPAMSPLDPAREGPWFEVLPAAHQTSVAPESLLNTATAGVVMHRTVDFSYEFRAEARLFARTVTENTNLNSGGQASAFVFEEAFGKMERMHFLIHMQSLSTMYALMGIDARTDPSSPRATYMQDWVSPEKGGGRWDRMIVEGGGRDSALTPQYWGG